MSAVCARTMVQGTQPPTSPGGGPGCRAGGCAVSSFTPSPYFGSPRAVPTRCERPARDARVNADRLIRQLAVKLFLWRGLTQRDALGIRRVASSHLPGLAILLLVALLLMSLISPMAADAQSSGLAATASGPKPQSVDGVPLVPTTKRQKGECQRFADHLKRLVPCPGLLPSPIPVSPTSAATLCPGAYEALGEGSCGPAGIEVGGNLFELSQSNFEVPADYVGVSFEQNDGSVVPQTSIIGGPLGHFVFMAGTDMQRVMTNRSRKGAAPVPSYCSLLHPSEQIRVHRSLAELFQCQDAADPHAGVLIVEGHTLLVWKDAGVTCEVSFHGHSQVNIDLDVAEADATVLIAPRGR